jgi:hypothetical protein
MFVNEESSRLNGDYASQAGSGSVSDTTSTTKPSASSTIKADVNEIDCARPMKVIVIGAGISGILAAIRFPRRIPKLDLVVYDKNPEVGGTWYENKYPGVACGKNTLVDRNGTRDIGANPRQTFLRTSTRRRLSPTPTGLGFMPLAKRFSPTGRELWQSTAWISI